MNVRGSRDDRVPAVGERPVGGGEREIGRAAASGSGEPCEVLASLRCVFVCVPVARVMVG